MLLTEARRPARSDAGGDPVLLADQDRTRWDGERIAEGHELVRACLRRNAPGPFQIQAAINAVHTDALVAGDTDWAQVVALYDQLLAVLPTDVVRLNRAVAVAEVDGPAAGLRLVEGLELDGYHAFHVVRADLLARLGRPVEAAAALERGRALTDNRAEARLIDLRAARHET